MNEVNRDHLIKEFKKLKEFFHFQLDHKLCDRAYISTLKYNEIREDIIKNYMKLESVMNSIIELDSNEEYFLPTGKKIEQIITNDFINSYGPINPNSSSDALEQRIIGAKLIIKNLIE